MTMGRVRIHSDNFPDAGTEITCDNLVLCTVYRKRVEVGDTLAFGKWSILLLPRE